MKTVTSSSSPSTRVYSSKQISLGYVSASNLFRCAFSSLFLSLILRSIVCFDICATTRHLYEQYRIVTLHRTLERCNTIRWPTCHRVNLSNIISRAGSSITIPGEFTLAKSSIVVSRQKHSEQGCRENILSDFLEHLIC